MDSPENDLVEQMLDDDFYKCFITQNAAQTLSKSLTITEQVKKLGDGIDQLNRELQKQVLEKHDDLLRQANHATKLENCLNTMNIHVQNLLANAERLKNQIVVPYNALETHTTVLERLHLASHILRQVTRIQQLSKRLSNTNDPVQKATVLQELEQLASDPNLKDIDVVTTELRNIRNQQQKVIKLATGTLNQGIMNENTTQTTTALQIFNNLGTLQEITTNLVDQNLSECRDNLKFAFEINAQVTNPSLKGKTPGKLTLSSSQGFRQKIWTELERVFTEDIYQTCKHIKFLQITLNELNITQNLDVAHTFWHRFGTILQDEVKKSSPAIQQMLEEDYPNILKYFHEMIHKLKYETFDFDRKVLQKYENSYLSSSLTHLLDPTQAMFNNLETHHIPTHDQIDSLIRIITSELSVALIEEHLSNRVAKNVSKCINMFAVKTEQQLETGPEAIQVINNLNSGQQKNLQLANSLHYLQSQIQRMLANMRESLTDSSAAIINESLKHLETLTESIIQPLIVSINSVIETILITIHLEPDWNKLQFHSNKNIVSCSPYMRELNQFINRVYNTYLTNFEHKEVLLRKCSEIAIRCIELFVRHSALLRPISTGGRQRLHSDYLHLEQALKVICPQLSDLGRPYRLLKSMASLITLNFSEIVQSQILGGGSSVPHSTVLLMLFSFASSELASPHQNTNWTLQKISTWLDEHPDEGDRLDLIGGALQRYESVVRQKNCVNYDPVYPVMSELLKTALKC